MKPPGRTKPHHRMLMSYARHDYGAVAAALGLRVTVLGQPEVIEQAAGRWLGNRIGLLAADLFVSWGIEGDAAVMDRGLHDWDDASAFRLLRCARGALPVGGQPFIVEMILAENGAAGGLCDVHLLAVNGGRERTAAEYCALLGEAGFTVSVDGIRRLPALPSVVVGVAK